MQAVNIRKINKVPKFQPRYNYRPGVRDAEGNEVIYDRQAKKYTGARRVMEQFKSRYGMRVASS